jgi:hypothetical protein
MVKTHRSKRSNKKTLKLRKGGKRYVMGQKNSTTVLQDNTITELSSDLSRQGYTSSNWNRPEGSATVFARVTNLPNNDISFKHLGYLFSTFKTTQPIDVDAINNFLQNYILNEVLPGLKRQIPSISFTINNIKICDFDIVKNDADYVILKGNIYYQDPNSEQYRAVAEFQATTDNLTGKSGKGNPGVIPY